MPEVWDALRYSDLPDCPAWVPVQPWGLSTEGTLAPGTWFFCAEWWTQAITHFTFDFPLFRCRCQQGRTLGRKLCSITTVLWDHSWDQEGRAGQGNPWARQTRMGRIIPPQPSGPVQEKEGSHPAGPPGAPRGAAPAPAPCGTQGTVVPLAGNRWQQILIAFIIIIFLCMCAQEIYRQLRRQNQLFML